MNNFPTEIVIDIIIKLNIKDAIRFCKSSKRLHDIYVQNKEYIYLLKYHKSYFNNLISYAKAGELSKLLDVPDEIWLKTDIECKSLYYYAISSYNSKLIRYLIKRKIMLAPETDTGNLDNMHIIDWCARYGKIDLIKILIKNKTLFITKNAIAYAAMNGHESVIKLLLAYDSEYTPKAIDLAAKNGHENIIKLLLEHNKDCTTNAIDWAAYSA